MAYDKDIAKPEHIGTDSLSKEVRDRVDYNLDISGVNVSRITRFLTSHELTALGRAEKISAKNDHLTRIQLLMLNDAYREAYEAATLTLRSVQSIAYDALKTAIDNFQRASTSVKEALSNASTLPDGTKVFLYGDTAYTEDGRELTQDDFLSVDWREGAISWTEFKVLKDNLNDAEERLDTVRKHTRRIDEIDKELKSYPDSPDRVQELTDELHEIKQDFTAEYAVAGNMEVTHISQPTSKLDMGF